MNKKVVVYSGLFVWLLASSLASQDKLMPIGDSITWGKINNSPPPAGSEGYRDLLHVLLTNDGMPFTFVGDSGSVNNRGHFTDNARIGWFLPDSAFNVNTALATHKPDFVILHIGTNNIGKGFPLGNYSTPGTIMYQLYNLVKNITDNSDVKYLLLCKIVPKFNSPGEELETKEYNNGMENMLTELSSVERAKITLIDMNTPFAANKNTYYNYDVDKVHPNQTGYNAMANIFYNYINKLKKPSYVDEFNFHPDRPWSAWVVTPGVQIINKGENGGGALQFTTTGDDNWDNIAVWKTSKNLNTCSMKLHSTSTAGDCYYAGLAVGLDSAKTAANGYMVWVHYNNKILIRTIVNGNSNAGTDVAEWPVSALQPGDVLRVSYNNTDPDNNYFYISINGGENITLRDRYKLTGKGTNLYSGLMFRGTSGGTPYNVLIDNFTMETQLSDVIPPGYIGDFKPFSTSNTSVTFTWTAPGDDGYVGKASSYDLRYSTNAINNETDFSTAKIVYGVSQPQDVNAGEIFTLSGLQSGTGYYFAVRAIDDWGNKGPLSDMVYAKTNSSGQIIETFDRPTNADGTIGADWLIDSNEYKIDYYTGTKEGELVNYQTDGQWGRVAVYLGRTNPSIVKMVWGTNATNDGIAQGGMALMLTNGTLNASGYLLWVRTTRKEIYLYNITSGRVVAPPQGLIDLVPYTLKDQAGQIRLPTRGDTMSVILDWNSPTGNTRFDVFINGLPAADRPLFDPQKRYNSQVKYSGVMLGRLNKTNNINAFITAGENTIGTTPRILSGDGKTGTVGKVLTDSLKVIVRDANNSPVPGVPVYFSVLEPPSATVSAPPVVADPTMMEAEWGVLTGTYNVKNDDPGASGIGYIVAPAGGPLSGTVTYQFYLDKDTTYYFWGRLISTDIYHSTLEFKMDNNPGWIWNSLKNRYSDAWQWDRVNDNDGAPKYLKLSKGLHFITITKHHSGVMIDKLLLTTKSSYVPTGKNVFDQLYTNSEGIAGTRLTLGTRAGVNRVQVRAFGSVETVTFTATGSADAPVSMLKSNSDQPGAARDTLPLPFLVTVYDQYTNPVPNAIIDFAVTSGDGKVLSPKDTTGADGKAWTRFILGITQAINKVRATVSGSSVTPLEFLATANRGLPKKVEIIKVTIPGRHLVGQLLPNFLKVRVLDESNNPMKDVGVTFQVAKGPATAGTQPKKTDNLGVATDSLRCGTYAGIARVIAKVGAIQDTVLRDSVFYKAVYLDFYGGSGQIGTVGDTLENRLRVRVTRPIGADAKVVEVVPSHPVIFVIKRGYGFLFPDGSDSIIVNTRNDGIAQTNVRLGPEHGQYQDIVSAKSSDGFFPLKQLNTTIKPTFTLYAKSKASRLVEVSGDSLEGVVRSTLKTPLTVRMVDDANLPVTSQPVDWEIKAGGGQFEGSLMPKMRILTDGDGNARVSYILGPTAGKYNNVVEASASNGVFKLTNSPVAFHLSAKSSAADSMSAVGSTLLSGTVGKPLPNKIQVKLTDVLGNPVAGAEVKFTVTKGNGALNGTADTEKTVVIDNAGGIASITWTLGTQAGIANNVLEASAGNGLLPLRRSPVKFTASGLPDSVSTIKSTIAANSPVQAMEKDTCWVTVTLTDGFSNPVSGKRVRLSVTGGDRNFIYDPVLPTDSQGKTRGYLQSLSAGEKEIRATDVDDNVRLAAVAKVIFSSDGAAKMQTYSGNSQTGNTGTELKDSLVVKITDKYDNPVAYGPVKFDVAGGGGHFIGGLTAVTAFSNANGLASVKLVLGSSPGENVVKVSSIPTQVLTGSPLYFSATGIKGIAVAMQYADGNSQSGPAGEVLPKPFKVRVIDKTLNPVSGVEVLFKITSGRGTIVTPQPSLTDEGGFTSCQFKPDTTAGTPNLVEASNPTLSGSPQRFSVTSTAGTARKLRIVSGNKQTGYVNQNITNPLLVKVTDAYGNGVNGIPIQYTVVSGDATVQEGQNFSVPSDPMGQAGVYLKLGSKAGPVLVEAVNPLLQGSPVQFMEYAVADPLGVTIEKFAGDNQKCRLGQDLVDPLRVRVLDRYGNGAAGISVIYSKDSGGGAILDVQPVVSDANGVASVRFRAGNATGKSYVSALGPDGKVVTFTIETVVNYSNPVLDKMIIADSYNVAEGTDLIIPMLASDLDNQPLTFQITDLFPPSGMIVQSQSPTTAVLRWTPGYDQSGSYKITLRVIDGYGGADEDTTRINVINVNRPPELVAMKTFPADTTFKVGGIIPLWVNYRDPDSNVLHYIWKVDGKNLENDSPVLQHYLTTAFTGIHTFDVFVSDGVVAVSQRWTVTVITKVTMSAMAARFDQNAMTVTVQWSTSLELHNLGFDILRSGSEDGVYEKINSQLIPSRKDRQYFFIDNAVNADRVYYYKIVDQDAYGNRTENGPLAVTIPKPEKFELMQNYPNPFNPVTTIRYNTIKRESVKLSVFNALGRRVALLVDKIHEPGFYTVQWDGKDESGRQTSTGIYLYKLESESQVQVLRMVKLQ